MIQCGPSMNSWSIHTRRLVWSTDQACSNGFYSRIAWKSTEWPCFLRNHSLSFLQGLWSLKNWLLQKLSMKVWTKNFNSSLKNGYFGPPIFQEIEFFEHLKYNFKTSWLQKISIFKKHFNAKITLISMIKKMALTFLDVKK